MHLKKINILYKDDSIIVCEKPAGMPVHSDKSRDMDIETLLKAGLVREEGADEEPYLTAVHRLDRPVGGLMVYARTKEAAAGLGRQIQTGDFEKNYQAVLCGEPAEDTGVLRDYLLRDGKTNTSKVVDKNTPGAKYAELEYELIDCIEIDQGSLTRVLVILHTGRHHQIRVQFASRGLGLYGDRKYNPAFAPGKAGKGAGNTSGGKNRRNKGAGRRPPSKGFSPLGLYATRISFLHPLTGERMTFKTEAQGEAFDKMDVEAF